MSNLIEISSQISTSSLQKNYSNNNQDPLLFESDANIGSFQTSQSKDTTREVDIITSSLKYTSKFIPIDKSLNKKIKKRDKKKADEKKESNILNKLIDKLIVDPPEDLETSSLAMYTLTSNMNMTKLETFISLYQNITNAKSNNDKISYEVL
ncbi:6441_t:CDS:2 [Ambispora leptoticha]|uniref:6441_t:CDS:1 n=1 Tax=Ambispora leptoticha TaxID=144679 RepID=A0A9N9BUC5_9GLOM|nr:6441_t:CDS:2 [Ambispora leptoticha]